MTPPRKLDYDDVAGAYAQHRRPDLHLVEELRAGGNISVASRVLEVGCGSGNYSAELERATGAACWGVDPSRAMLAAARQRSRECRFFLGSAESLPFAADEFDFAFSVDVVHHVADRTAYFNECRRVLRNGAWLCTATDDESSIRDRLHSQYFPDTVEVEIERYSSLASLSSAMTAAGFVETTESRLEQPYDVTDSRPYRDKAFSSLHLIPEPAFRRGLEQLERDLRAGSVRGIARHVLLWGRKA